MTLPEMGGLLRALEQLPACRQRWFARATVSQGGKTNPIIKNKGVCLKGGGKVRELKVEEMQLLYWFGCPNRKNTKERLRSAALLATDSGMKRKIIRLCRKLDRRSVLEHYPEIYFHICEVFSPDDGTRPPGSSALMVPKDDCMAA